MLTKAEIRQIAKTKRRDALKANPGYENALVKNFDYGFVDGALIAGFYPRSDEINILPLLESLSKQGAKLCLPRINEDNNIDFHEYEIGEKLIAAPFGLLEPDESRAVVCPDIILVPLLAFDSKGNRIGYGKGHYDKAISKLALNQKTTLIGIAFDEQEFDEIPAEAHDQKLNYLLTPSGFRNLSNQA